MLNVINYAILISYIIKCQWPKYNKHQDLVLIFVFRMQHRAERIQKRKLNSAKHLLISHYVPSTVLSMKHTV